MRYRDLLAPLLLVIVWVLLILRVPIASVVFHQINLQLHLLAFHVAAAILSWFGIVVQREGNILETPTMVVAVVGASNMRLMVLITLAVIYGYLTEKRSWVRWLLVLATGPIAVVVNIVCLILLLLLENSAFADRVGIFFLMSLMMLITLHLLISAASKSCSEVKSG
jgi:hypothetical protein